MKRRNLFVLLCLFLMAGIGAMAAENDEPKYNASQKEFYLNQADMAFIQPGLNLKIQSVEVKAPDVSVTFRISDNNDQPLDKDGKETPGTVVFGFVLARIKPGQTQYSAYTRRDFALPSGGTSNLPWTDPAGGTYTSLGNGVYKYTFATKLPANFEADATHTVGIQANRDLRALAEQLGLFQLAKNGRYQTNALLNFVPSGKEVTQVRDVVRTANCNQCHDPLALHGGNRRETGYCILCHQPENTDPRTGNSLDFKVYIHKIHQSAFLPSVMGKDMNPLSTSGSNTSATPATTANGATPGPIGEGVVPAGTPYKLGNGDFSTIVWPQDTRNCTTCHQGGAQSDNYKTNPNRAACGSCHDNVNFATGANHAGGTQNDDSLCSICHQADGAEFDLSVAGVHTIPARSKQLAGLVLTITGVTNSTPGSKPTVTFTAADNKGNPVDATKLNFLQFLLAGPTTDYTFSSVSATSGLPAGENALTTVKPSGSGFTYTFTTAIPANAKGTFTVGAQGYRLVTVPGSLLGQSFAVRESSNNPVYYFSVDGTTVAERRTVVDVKNCNTCHKTLALHGGTRTNATAYCQTCHRPGAVDDGLPINFVTHIHRIHTGEDLENDWTVGRNYNGLLFPGDRRHCEKCHLGPETGTGVARTYDLPLSGTRAAVDAPALFYTPMGGVAAACLGCHDGEDAAAHAFLQTAIFPSGKTSESCPVCHEEGAEFSVTRVHAR